MHPIIITTCTKRKTVAPRLYVPSEKELFESQEQLAEFWQTERERLVDTAKIQAGQLYNGRSFKRAVATAKTEDNLYIVSAGLGLVQANEMVIPYEMTISSAAPNRVSKKMQFGGFDKQLWWSSINSGNDSPIADLIANTPDRHFILALSREYVELIMDDLKSIDEEDYSRVSIVGYNLDEILPLEMFDLFLPYDERLNKAPRYVGTKLDFAIRACAHAVDEKVITSDDPIRAVSEAMDKYGTLDPEVEGSNSRRVTDEEVVELIKKHWDRYRGRKTMLLRVLREVEQVSCAQKRFDGLFKVVLAERNA